MNFVILSLKGERGEGVSGRPICHSCMCHSLVEGGRGWPKDARCHSFYRFFFKASLSLIQTRYFLLFLFTFIEGVGLSCPYIPVICNLIIDVKLEACWRKGFTRLAGNPQPGIFHFESELLWFNQKFTLISITFIYIYMSRIDNLDKAEDAAKSKLYL